MSQDHPTSKKQEILTLYQQGTTDLHELAEKVSTNTSYVAGVLQQENLLTGYFDLYTPIANLLNVYAKFFAYRLGFKTEKIAKRSVEAIDRAYHRFEKKRDRAGQHHALATALMLFDRARWSKKLKEAEIFRVWLLDRLKESFTDTKTLSSN